MRSWLNYYKVEATAAAKKAVDNFATVQEDGVHFCPRCGRMSVKDKLRAQGHGDLLPFLYGKLARQNKL